MTALRLVRMALVVAAFTSYAGLAGAAATPIRQLTADSQGSLRPAWSPDAKRIAYQRNERGDQYHVYVMDADGGNGRRVTAGDVDDRHPEWSPDGKVLAVDSGSDNMREIWLIDVATTQRTQVTRIGGIAAFPSWSPDGQRLAFYVYRAGTTDLWAVGRDGSAAQQLTQGLASEQREQCTFACHAAAWSPRGDRIALASGDQARVLVMQPTAGSVPEAISPDDERSHFPVFLKDGRLVYVSEHITLDQSWTDLWAVPADGAARAAVATNVQVQGPFALTPDGNELLFHSPRSGSFEIYAVTLDDAGRAALAERVIRGEGGAEASLTPAAAAARAAKTGVPFGDSAPWLLGLLAVGLVGLGIELFVRARRTPA